MTVLAAGPPAEQIGGAFWAACHGGRQTTAQHLLGRGAGINRAPRDGHSPLEAARRNGLHDLADWLRQRGAQPSA